MRCINLDITHRCTLQCLRCLRNAYDRVPGHDMSVDEYNKIVSYFSHVNFCGNISDPVMNPFFLDFLKINYDNNISCEIHNAATGKSLDWYNKAFTLNPNARWIFGLDGLPEQSHNYRVNQKGQQLFNAMKLCSSMGLDATWRMIVFSFNEDSIDQCKQLANEINVKFELVKSSRFRKDDPLKPTKYFINRDYEKDISKMSA